MSKIPQPSPIDESQFRPVLSMLLSPFVDRLGNSRSSCNFIGTYAGFPFISSWQWCGDSWVSFRFISSSEFTLHTTSSGNIQAPSCSLFPTRLFLWPWAPAPPTATTCWISVRTSWATTSTSPSWSCALGKFCVILTGCHSRGYSDPRADPGTWQFWNTSSGFIAQILIETVCKFSNSTERDWESVRCGRILDFTLISSDLSEQSPA